MLQSFTKTFSRESQIIVADDFVRWFIWDYSMVNDVTSQLRQGYTLHRNGSCLLLKSIGSDKHKTVFTFPSYQWSKDVNSNNPAVLSLCRAGALSLYNWVSVICVHNFFITSNLRNSELHGSASNIVGVVGNTFISHLDVQRVRSSALCGTPALEWLWLHDL